jgi:hypothetical protein
MASLRRLGLGAVLLVIGWQLLTRLPQPYGAMIAFLVVIPHAVVLGIEVQ